MFIVRRVRRSPACPPNFLPAGAGPQ